jgi:hypothetical protein
LRLATAALFLLVLPGCLTPRIDWNARIGQFSHDQALMELGPPDKAASLSDQSIVAEWLISRGYTTYYPPIAYGFAPWNASPYYGSSFMQSSPNYFLRLTFGPDHLLRTWKRFAK